MIFGDISSRTNADIGISFFSPPHFGLSFFLELKLLAVTFIPAFTTNMITLDFLSFISRVPRIPSHGIYISQLARFARARRGGVGVAGWTVIRKTRVRSPGYPHRVWAL